MTAETRESEVGDAFYDAHHIGLIHMVREYRRAEKEAKQMAESPANLLKAYLEETGQPLEDGELGLRARLQERSGWEWDIRNAPDALVLDLARTGLLKVDNAAFDALRKAAPTATLDDAARYRRQITASTALIIEEIK